MPMATFGALLVVSLLGFVACASFVVAHPVSLALPALFIVLVLGLALAEAATRTRIREWCRAEARLGLWQCDEASWRWSIAQSQGGTTAALAIVALLSTVVVTFAAAVSSDGAELGGVFGFGASWCGLAWGVGGFERARRHARQLRDPRREVVFGRSFVLLGEQVLQLNAEPRLKDVSAAVWLLECSVAPGASMAWSGTVLRFTVMTLHRNAPRLDVLSFAVPASVDVADLVASYGELAHQNRHLNESG